MFDFTWVGVPVALACLLVLAAASRRLPRRWPLAEQAKQPYFLEARVLSESPLVGRSIEANRLRNLQGLYLVEIVRGGRLLSPVGPDEVIQAGDQLIFAGEVERVQALQRFEGLQIFGVEHAHDLLASNLVEVVLAQQSELVDKTLREVDFRTLFDAGVIGIRRGSRRLRGQLGRIPLRVGDSLLLAVGPDFRNRRNLERNFHVLGQEPLRPPLRPRDNALVVGGFATVIVLAALQWLPLLQGLLILLGVLLASGVLTLGDLRRRFPFELWMIIGSALAIAAGMERSGAAALMVQGVQGLFGELGPWGSLALVYAVTWLLTELVSNSAAAAMTFPLALAMARAHGVDPTPFVMVVAYAASAGFLLPFGYQTHLMVYSAGGYRMQDFVRVGWPLALVYAVVVLGLVPLVFPF